MKKTFILCALLFSAPILTSCAGFDENLASPAQLQEVSVNTSEALRQTNAWRKQNGLPPLQLDAHLNTVSQDMANHVASRDSLDTSRHSSRSLIKRIDVNGYRSSAGAENLGAGYQSLDAAMAGWKNSPDHNKNLLNPYVTRMGIARTNRSNGTYRNFWVMTLAAPKKKPENRVLYSFPSIRPTPTAR